MFRIWFKFQWSLFLRAQLTKGSIGSGNGMAPNRRQAMTWTNTDTVSRCIYVALGEDELTEIAKETGWNCVNYIMAILSIRHIPVHTLVGSDPICVALLHRTSYTFHGRTMLLHGYRDEYICKQNYGYFPVGKSITTRIYVCWSEYIADV